MNISRIITVATCVSFPVIIVMMAIQPEPPAVRCDPSTATQPATREAAAEGPAVRGEAGSAPSPARPAPRVLLDAIRQVESGGDALPPDGDGGKSIGRFQIQAAYWKDACEYGGVSWDWRIGAWDDAKCRQAITWYAARYGAKTPEEIARCHNSGSGWKAKYHLTNNYWKKVRLALEAETADGAVNP